MIDLIVFNAVSAIFQTYNGTFVKVKDHVLFQGEMRANLGKCNDEITYPKFTILHSSYKFFVIQT